MRFWLEKWQQENWNSYCCCCCSFLSSDDFHLMKCSFHFAYLKYLISDTCQWSIATQCAYLKYINAPCVNIAQHCTQCWLMTRLDTIAREFVAREWICMHEWTFEARNLWHCSWWTCPSWISWCWRCLLWTFNVDFLLLICSVWF